MKRWAILTSIIVVLSFQVVLGNDLVTTNEIEISGFMDVINSYQNSNNDVSQFSLGQAEIDLYKDISPKSSVDVGIAYNNDDAKFELGTALLNLHLFGGESKNSGSIVYDKSYLHVGLFDVPFGIDYNSYASIDRKLISTPRVVELTHGGWNDLGAMLSVHANLGNLTVYAVNGFESSAEITTQIYNLALATYEDSTYEVNTTPAAAFGGRIGLNLFSNLEIGSSGAVGLNESEEDEMILLGADIQFAYQNFSLKGEYINHSVNRSVNKEDNKGYYIQAIQQFERFYLTSRYGSFQPENVEWVGQMSVGAGMVVTENVEFRVESLIHETSANNKTMVQLVAGF